MHRVDVVKLDGKGRILVPIDIRRILGLRKGMYLLIVADSERGEIRLTPFLDSRAKLARITVGLKDIPGALARIAGILAEIGIDLLFSESRTIRRGEEAEWIAVADMTNCDLDPDSIKEKLLLDGGATSARIEVYR
ncbi:MAG: ACT domain-containing protein [Nitrososphaerota archaeon]|nr:ACT domain-containing protein [Candidatus Bathyarchaeota archaeon]MCX8161727.1 ACT domain-containing protein [Candidatus Bathyarchaeota archaeon]MDW8061235.1 ACT domain-containing protein [Nitrososphaerota archaeon]